jgi:D-alanyl-D-alanine carboxypeptidase (penicillin-binding protein 5/6)
MLLLAMLAAVATFAAAPAAHAAKPRIAAPEAIVVDATTGEALYAKNPDRQRAIASTTKLMTALITLEQGRLGDVVTAQRYRGSPVESQIGLQAGERMTVADLMRAMLIVSANDAAATLAEHIGGSRSSFVRMMNRRAQQLGLTGTHYANPIGLDEEGNHSTAADLAKLTIKLREWKFFRETVATARTVIKTGARPRLLVNRNTLVTTPHLDWIDGVKTGFTAEAGDVLVASGRKRGNELISVVLGEPSKAVRDEDSLELLDYGAGRYHRKTIIRSGDVVARVPVRYRAGADLPLVAVRGVQRWILRGRRPTLKPIGIPARVEGPVSRGQRLGRVQLWLDGRLVTTVSLQAGAEVPAAGAIRRAQHAFTDPWGLVVVGIALAAIAALGAHRARESDGLQRRGGPGDPPAGDPPAAREGADPA